MNSKDITVTKGRALQSVTRVIGNEIMPTVNQNITTAVEEERIKTGTITKFYPYIDKCLVQLNNSDETILCKILHRFGGELTEYYTPEGEQDYCNDLHEICVYPRVSLDCLIMNIHHEDSSDWLMLGYFVSEELVGTNPAQPGNFKITYMGGNNENWIKFGVDGLDIRLFEKPKIEIGDYDEDMAPDTPVDTYSKQEIDQMLEDLRNELMEG